jgi:hypothetical protein
MRRRSATAVAARPALEIEYSPARESALTGTMGLLLTSPQVTLSTPEGRFNDRWDASSLYVWAGFVVYPFR